MREGMGIILRVIAIEAEVSKWAVGLQVDHGGEVDGALIARQLAVLPDQVRLVAVPFDLAVTRIASSFFQRSEGAEGLATPSAPTSAARVPEGPAETSQHLFVS